MACNKLLKEALENIESKDSMVRAALDKWITNSKDIVKAYVKTGKHKELDRFFSSVTPDYKDTASRIGMVDKDLVSKLKPGDYTTNPFPFATSKNPEENDIFSRIVDKRLPNHQDKIKVKYEIDNSNVPQYDLTRINPAETEVLVKPNTAFVIDSIDKSNNLITIRLVATRNRRNKATIPLLSAAALLPLADNPQEEATDK